VTLTVGLWPKQALGIFKCPLCKKM